MKLNRNKLQALRLAEETAALAKSPKGRRTLAATALKSLDLKKVKLTALAVGGGALVIGAAGSAARYEAYRLAVSRELKKQLAPINAKLEELEKQNAELRKELEKLKG